MGIKLIFVIFALFLFISISKAVNDSSLTSPISSTTMCKSTPDPTYCKSILPPNQPANVYDYTRYSVKKSISQSTKFLFLIEKYLTLQKLTLSTSATRALQDCKYLAQTNLDFLTNSFQTVNTTSKTLSVLKADDIRTFLSAILTNQETCFEGISSASSAWNLKNGIFSPLATDTKLYSVSLALFTKGWVPKTKQKSATVHGGRRLLSFENGRVPIKMSQKTQVIYARASGRKMLQESGGGGGGGGDDDGDVVVNDMVVVSQDGSGNFSTINEAIAAAPNNSVSGNGYFMIYVTAGVYEEYVLIAKNKKYLMMVGDGINQTVITGDRNVVDGWTTFNSATFAVTATGFVAINMTFRNTAGAIKHQAVALRNGADLSTFYQCSFEAYQDTLYTHSLRQFYRECDIYGTVDFIFGNAAVVLQNCNIYPRLPMSGQFNAITAQGRTDPNQNTGTSIQNCTIKASDDLASSSGGTKTYLGRPWKEYSRTVYSQCFMDSLIEATGWREWNGDFALSSLYYAEYNNFGPGSDTSGRVTWGGYRSSLNDTEAAGFSVASFILGDDWLPQTGVTYSSGL